ncbi:MAG: hypothetical protein NKF70_13145 [Methanobacterium sp. ERen5]|nr:MAG: hypothetical protein NKF70_13145 [Methanobacterium sp. ERen5]
MSKYKIASYPQTDEAETDAVNKFEILVSDRRVKVHVNKRDKIPNHDGYIELVDDDLKPIGKLDVQLKKLPDDFNPHEPKIKIPLALYGYSKTVTANPTLFIGVDIKRNIAYWIYIHDNLRNYKNRPLNELEFNTTTISLNLNNDDNGLIDGDNKEYIIRWKAMALDHLNRVNTFNEIKELSKYGDPSLGLIDDDFIFIHTFLDHINQYLNIGFVETLIFFIFKSRFFDFFGNKNNLLSL